MIETADTAEVSLGDGGRVTVRRRFRVPRERLWKAYTTPAQVQRWLLGPPGWSMPVCRMDLRQGGRFEWRWRNEADGKEFGFSGEFREVVPLERIVHTEHYDPGTVGDAAGDGHGEPILVTLELDEADDDTEMATEMDFGTREARDAALATGMADGMEASYQQLEEFLDETCRAAG